MTRPELKYTVDEIHRMRCDVGRLIGSHASRLEIEAMLQTYLINGTDPQELENAAEQADKKRRELTHSIQECLTRWPKGITHAGGIGGGI